MQFADEEQDHPHKTPEPSDNLVSPAKDAPAEANPTDDNGSYDQQVANIKEGAEASLAEESTLQLPIKSSKGKFSLNFLQSWERAESKASSQSLSVFSSKLGEGRRLPLKALKKTVESSNCNKRATNCR